MRRYRALLIGNWHYPDDPANLPDLKGPLNDVSRLAEALVEASTGLFAPADVTTLTERASHEITAALESFFAEATREDVLLVYYSGHGITADHGALLLCGRNARTDRRLATTVSAETINQMVRGCPAAAVVIVLDCCHAGAFKSGDLAAELAGKGRFVLTASRARDRAPDAEHATGLSSFTAHLLRGLRGEAALPGATHITLSDLYRYVHARMSADGPVIPQRRFDGDGEVAIARNALAGAPMTAPAPLGSPSLAISETLIDVGDVAEGDELPPERVRIHCRTPDGQIAAWTAETEADWVTLHPQPAHLDLRIRPRAGRSRANVHVTNQVTGEIRTIRILAGTVAAHRGDQPASAPAAACPADASADGAGPAGAGPAGGRDARRPVPAPAAPPPLARQREYLLHIPAQQLQSHVTETLAAHPMAGVVVRPTGRTRGEQSARERCGVSPQEATLGALDLEGNGFVLFTDRAVYWTNQGNVAAFAYLRGGFRREFRFVPPAHVDFGDGVARLVGARAVALVKLLNALLDRLAPPVP